MKFDFQVIRDAILLFLFVSFLTNFLLDVVLHPPFESDGGIKVSDLTHDTPLQICTEYVNSDTIVCESRNKLLLIHPTYHMNVTEEEVMDFIRECPDAKIVERRICRGDKIRVYNPYDK